MPSPTRDNGSSPPRKGRTRAPPSPSNEGYEERIAAVESCNKLLQELVVTLQADLQTANTRIQAMQGQILALTTSVEKIGDAVLNPTPDAGTERRLEALETGLRDVGDAVQRQSRAVALDKEQAQGKGDSVLLVAHVPEGPKALDMVKQAVIRTGCDTGSVICVTHLGSSARPQRAAATALDKARAAAAITAAATAAAGSSSSAGGETSGAGPSHAPVAGPTRRITCLVRVSAPEVRSHVLKNKRRLSEHPDVGGVFIDPYFSKPADVTLFRALKTKEKALRQQGTRCRWVGPLALQQQLNGAWVPVSIPPPTGAPARGRGRSSQGRKQGDYPPPPAANGSGGTAPRPALPAADGAAAAGAAAAGAAAAGAAAAAGPTEGAERRDGGRGRGEKGGSPGPSHRGNRPQGPSQLP